MDLISKVQSGNIIKADNTTKNVSNVDFKELLVNALEEVNKDQLYAEEMDQKFMLGEVSNIHDVMIASQKAELSLSFAVEVRNKVLEAYKEIMRIQM
ncbi:flagellar hook-basal body complex protein FliE [Acidaminobacter sp. JC074]|uniref:flagellar hook-basal body complex protein FliE n=1 Tax=Acidaminobacter sp. JC074 TaxID=2530199 RepID=UPI001F1020A0|nr:flagellar hook-basal body complex protein FliE [Acidaminobacter sp. JC074]MCH4888716.1 flagellar hook-basal body complex protein FliE [Acidaminobacter sp. JC074]